MADKNDKKKIGYVYILTNPAFPDYVKIGYTHDLDKRIKELSASTGVPRDFQKYAWYETEDELSDKIIHRLLDTINPKLRVGEPESKKKNKKEFFDMPKEQAYEVLQALAEFSHSSSSLHRIGEDEENNKEGPELKGTSSVAAKTPAERFSFFKCQIPVGAELTFDDNPSIKAYVADEHEVVYDGKQYSLTALTKELRNNIQAVQGTKCWRYRGEILTDIRARLESEGLYK